ncbi:MAG TPA: protein-disulfide reductase DsbD domain-containing protein [Bryobacteraceae bacterium]
MKLLPILGLLALPPRSPAETSPLLTAAPPQKITAHRGEAVEARITLQLRGGYHVNSNTPNDDYLIPLRLKWQPGPLVAGEVIFPKPEQRNYSFSSKPVSVFTGDFQVTVKFKVEPNAPAGLGAAIGKLRYQACSEDTCYRPAALEIRLPYEIH